MPNEKNKVPKPTSSVGKAAQSLLKAASPRRHKRKLEFFAAACLPMLYLVFVVTEHYDVWDSLRGLSKVKAIAANMNTSYVEVKRVFRDRDEGFDETLALIRKYSPVPVREGRTPMMIARHVAVLSGKADLGDGKIAEWTAPTTPLILFYTDPPQKNEYAYVGTIGDLYTWIDRSKADFRFLVQDVFLGLFSLVLGVLIWKADLKEQKHGSSAQ